MTSGIQQSTRIGQIAVRPHGDSKCPLHRQKHVVLYCSCCEELICIKCSISIHNGHQQMELEDILPQRKSRIQRFINDTQRETLVAIRKEIKSIGNSLQVQNRDSLKYKEELQKRYDSAIEQVEECKHVLQSGTAVEVFDEAANIAKLERDYRTPETKMGESKQNSRNDTKAQYEAFKNTAGIPNNPSDIELRTKCVRSRTSVLELSSANSAPQVQKGSTSGDFQGTNRSTEILPSESRLTEDIFLDHMQMVDTEVLSNRRSRRNAIYVPP